MTLQNISKYHQSILCRISRLKIVLPSIESTMTRRTLIDSLISIWPTINELASCFSRIEYPRESKCRARWSGLSYPLSQWGHRCSTTLREDRREVSGLSAMAQYNPRDRKPGGSPWFYGLSGGDSFAGHFFGDDPLSTTLLRGWVQVTNTVEGIQTIISRSNS